MFVYWRYKPTELSYKPTELIVSLVYNSNNYGYGLWIELVD